MNRLNFSKYTYREKVKREIIETTKVYTDLIPKMELYTFNDGVQRNLIALNGTIKVFYVSQTYNIPICVYMTESHPYNPPLCYVRPTNTMQIKTSQNVDGQGRVYLPYLSEWVPEKSDLQGLLSIMQIEFGEKCPVFSKPAGSGYSNPPVNSYYPSTVYNPYNQNSHGIGSGWGGNVNSSMPYPPLNNSSPVNSTPSYMPGLVNTNMYQPSHTETNQLTQNSMRPWNTNAGINDDVLRISILSAVEDKVHRHSRDIFAQYNAELDVLENTHRDLVNGSETLKKFLSGIQNELSIVLKSKTELTDDNINLKASVAKCQSEEDDGINYDEVVEPSAPLYKQLFSLYIEEQSIEDALYYMGEGIGKKVIDIETFLKRVRELSRKQFVLRATIKKCREKAGLPDV